MLFFSRPKVHRPAPPLKNMQVVILGKTNTPKDELKTQITTMGGKVVTKIHDKLAFVISNLGTVHEAHFMTIRVCYKNLLKIHPV